VTPCARRTPSLDLSSLSQCRDVSTLKSLVKSGDRQVFKLQQRALGEALFVLDGSELRCMRFSEFLEKWTQPAFKPFFDPLSRFIDQLKPENTLRWKRLELMAQALEQLRLECERLLTIKAD
jgi:hypothetical protein